MVFVSQIGEDLKADRQKTTEEDQPVGRASYSKCWGFGKTWVIFVSHENITGKRKEWRNGKERLSWWKAEQGSSDLSTDQRRGWALSTTRGFQRQQHSSRCWGRAGCSKGMQAEGEQEGSETLVGTGRATEWRERKRWPCVLGVGRGLVCWRWGVGSEQGYRKTTAHHQDTARTNLGREMKRSQTNRCIKMPSFGKESSKILQ